MKKPILNMNTATTIASTCWLMGLCETDAVDAIHEKFGITLWDLVTETYRRNTLLALDAERHIVARGLQYDSRRTV